MERWRWIVAIPQARSGKPCASPPEVSVAVLVKLDVWPTIPSASAGDDVASSLTVRNRAGSHLATLIRSLRTK
jgi:hypothetical protein